jgi:hypothetical protein
LVFFWIDSCVDPRERAVLAAEINKKNQGPYAFFNGYILASLIWCYCNADFQFSSSGTVSCDKTAVVPAIALALVFSANCLPLALSFESPL